MHSYYKPFLTIFSFVLCSCSVDDSYFSDPTDPRIPVYSFEGNNNAGAYINGDPWRTICLSFGEECLGRELRYIDSLDQTLIRFPSGRLYSGNLTTPVDIGFRLKGDLISFILNAPPQFPMEILLDGAENYGEIGFWNGTEWIYSEGGTGKLFLRELIGDIDSFIAAGTFGFNIKTSGGDFSVYEGRFDFVFESDSVN